MKKSYTEEELNILYQALDQAISITVDIRKNYTKYFKISLFQGIMFAIIAIGSLCGFPLLRNCSTSSIFLYLGFSILLIAILGRISYRKKIVLIDAINEYRAIFHRLEKDVHGIEPPIELWSDRIVIYQNGMVNRYKKEYIPKDLNERCLLAEKKLLEMKDQINL